MNDSLIFFPKCKRGSACISGKCIFIYLSFVRDHHSQICICIYKNIYAVLSNIEVMKLITKRSIILDD